MSPGERREGVCTLLSHQHRQGSRATCQSLSPNTSNRASALLRLGPHVPPLHLHPNQRSG